MDRQPIINEMIRSSEWKILGLNFVYALVGAKPILDVVDGRRMIGVDRLTSWVLEQRVALEACA